MIKKEQLSYNDNCSLKIATIFKITRDNDNNKESFLIFNVL